MKVFNHGIHILLDVITLGLWIPVHLLLWLVAPTVPIGGGFASAAASANTTIVMAGPAPVHHAPYAPAAPAHTATPPMWAIDVARSRLPMDAPWDAVAAVAWEITREPQPAVTGVVAGYPEPRQLPHS